jgi:hypothetical protein
MDFIEKACYDIRLPVLPAARFAHESEFDRTEPGYVDTPADLNCPAHVVTDRSHSSVRKAVEQLARYFRRELGYDSVQYLADEHQGRDRTYLWTHGTYHNHKSQQLVIGACCFRWGDGEDRPPGWAMAWCWFHPYQRRQGHLSEAWAYFLARFPGFVCERPFSDAMAKFLLKRGYFDERDRERAVKQLLGEKASQPLH